MAFVAKALNDCCKCLLATSIPRSLPIFAFVTAFAREVLTQPHTIAEAIRYTHKILQSRVVFRVRSDAWAPLMVPFFNISESGAPKALGAHACPLAESAGKRRQF